LAKEARQIYETKIVQAKEAAWSRFLKETEGADETYIRYKILCKRNDTSTSTISPVRGPNGLTNSAIETAKVLLHTTFPPLELTTDDSDLIDEINTYTSSSTDSSEPPITPNEIKIAIDNIKVNKAPGPDNIPGSVIKEITSILVPILTKLFNASLTTSHFPKEWKIANVIFLHKPGKILEDPTSRRPISLLSHLGKVLERVILNRLHFLADSNNWISNNQFGFRKGIGSVEAAFHLATKISSGFKKRKDTLAVFLDIVGAFNNVWPDAVAHRLVKRKAPISYVKLIRSYLKDRVPQVKTNEGTVSTDLTNSCPQGGVLSPFLCLLFIDDLLECNHIQADLKQGFADDLVLGIQGKNRLSMINKMNRLLRLTTEWAKKWKIKFNTSKTKSVLFSKSTKPTTFRLNLEGSRIESVPHFRYLGITFDSKLLWRKHVEHQCSRASRLLLILKAVTKRNWGLPQKTNKFIYKRAIEPILLYGSPVWSKALDKSGLCTLLRRTQRLAALTITGILKTTSTDALLILAGLTPVDLLAKERSALQFIKWTEHKKTSELLNIKHNLILHNKHSTHDSSLQFMQRSAIELASYNIGNQTEQAPPIPPWEYLHHTILISEEDTSSLALTEQSTFNYFTDASQNSIGNPIGIGVVLHQKTENFAEITKIQLPGSSSVFQGELTAISKALLHAQEIDLRNTNINVFSDSRSGLEALKSFDSPHPTIRHIHSILRDLKLNRKCTVKLIWVRGHSGNLGNETADRLAKLARNEAHPEIESNTINFLSSHYYKNKLSKATQAIWQEEWNTSSLGRLTYEIFPNISDCATVYELINNLKNSSRSLIFQALSGHMPVNGYLHRFHLQPNSACNSCGAPFEDISHLLVTCPRFSLTRYHFLSAKNTRDSQMTLSDYFKQWSLPLTLQILSHRFKNHR
jgi:ribonuclease HI